jgi:hypothetical protein
MESEQKQWLNSSWVYARQVTGGRRVC